MGYTIINGVTCGDRRPPEVYQGGACTVGIVVGMGGAGRGGAENARGGG